MTQLVLREDKDGLCVLTLNRPKVLNALSPSLFVELQPPKRHRRGNRLHWLRHFAWCRAVLATLLRS